MAANFKIVLRFDDECIFIEEMCFYLISTCTFDRFQIQALNNFYLPFSYFQIHKILIISLLQLIFRLPDGSFPRPIPRRIPDS